MPAIPKKTKGQVRRIVELYGSNRSITEIARIEKLSRPTVRRWLVDEGVDVREDKVDTAAQRATKTRKEKMAGIVVAAGSLEGESVEHLGLATCRARLAQIRALIEPTMAAVAAGDVGGVALSKLGELELKYAAKYEELSKLAKPPERPDPDKDPTNAETVSKLVAKLEALVVHEEKHR